MCKLVSYLVPEGPPYYANGASKAITQCTEHSWTAEPLAFVGGLCPLGRIEKAVEDGLVRLKSGVQ